MLAWRRPFHVSSAERAVGVGTRFPAAASAPPLRPAGLRRRARGAPGPGSTWGASDLLAQPLNPPTPCPSVRRKTEEGVGLFRIRKGLLPPPPAEDDGSKPYGAVPWSTGPSAEAVVLPTTVTGPRGGFPCPSKGNPCFFDSFSSHAVPWVRRKSRVRISALRTPDAPKRRPEVAARTWGPEGRLRPIWRRSGAGEGSIRRLSGLTWNTPAPPNPSTLGKTVPRA